MHRRISFALVFQTVVLAVLLGLTPIRPAAAAPGRNDAAEMFYSDLAPYGVWVQHHVYGRVWFPRNVPRNWRPYTDGYWAFTGDNGWLWVSDWAWGWATDHYGRWVWDDWYGWIWVPGTIWAPAWVVWRYGGGYVSWAPMPPQYIWRPSVSYTTDYFIFDNYIKSECWVITHERDFPRRHKPRRFIASRENRKILNRTRYIDPMTVVHNHVYNQGVPVKRIERAIGSRIRPISPKTLTEWKDQKTDRRGKYHKDKETVIYRPFHEPLTSEKIRNEEQRARELEEQTRRLQKLSDERQLRPPTARGSRLSGRLMNAPESLDDRKILKPISIPPAKQQPVAPNFTGPGSRGTVPGNMGNEQGAKGRDQARKEYRIPGRPETVKPLDGSEPRQQWESKRRRTESERMQREAIRGQEESVRRQQTERERQQRGELERMQRESIRRQEEAARHQRTEQGRMQRGAMRQREEVARQQQIQLQRQQQVEQERLQREAIGRREGSVRQQRIEMERQQRSEQERMQRERMRQQEESARQQKVIQQQREIRQAPKMRQIESERGGHGRDIRGRGFGRRQD